MSFRSGVALAALLGAVSVAGPLAAQDRTEATPPPVASTAAPDAANAYDNTVFNGDWISIGAGAILTPSYTGSNDYEITPIPVIQGRVAGIGINPRPAGLALNFLPSVQGKPSLSLGIAGRLDRNRAERIKDPVVEEYGELDTGVEVGPTVGVRFPGVLNPYDSLSVNVDVLWDVAGASKGMIVNPSVSYFTPVSRGAAVSLSLSARHVNDRFADYYYSVPTAPASVPVADQLPVYNAQGGFDKLSATLFGAIDLDGNLANGGWAVFAIGGYSHLQGSAADTPFTSIRGSVDQWMAGLGLGYTF
ncbi:MAG: MipA/OmpV family protein [Sphingomonadaceae bacterium]